MWLKYILAQWEVAYQLSDRDKLSAMHVPDIQSVFICTGTNSVCLAIGSFALALLLQYLVIYANQRRSGLDFSLC